MTADRCTKCTASYQECSPVFKGAELFILFYFSVGNAVFFLKSHKLSSRPY